MIKKYFWIVPILFVSVGIAQSQPKFNIVGGNTFDYGELYWGIARKNLVIRNEGDDTLLISNVSASCGCTGTLLSNDHIAPGDSGVLGVAFDIKKASGKVLKAVSLETNDSNNKKVRITFSANVIPTLDIMPDYLYLRGSLDSAMTQQMKIKNSSTGNINILSIKSSLETISISPTDKLLKPTESVTINYTLRPKTAGTFKGNIDIYTDHPKIPVLNIRVVGLVPGNNKPGPGSQK